MLQKIKSKVLEKSELVNNPKLLCFPNNSSMPVCPLLQKACKLCAFSYLKYENKKLVTSWTRGEKL